MSRILFAEYGYDPLLIAASWLAPDSHELIRDLQHQLSDAYNHRDRRAFYVYRRKLLRERAIAQDRVDNVRAQGVRAMVPIWDLEYYALMDIVTNKHYYALARMELRDVRQVHWNAANMFHHSNYHGAKKAMHEAEILLASALSLAEDRIEAFNTRATPGGGPQVFYEERLRAAYDFYEYALESYFEKHRGARELYDSLSENQRTFYPTFLRMRTIESTFDDIERMAANGHYAAAVAELDGLVRFTITEDIYKASSPFGLK